MDNSVLLEKIKNSLKRSLNSTFYSHHFKDYISLIQNLHDIQQFQLLPYTNKSDLRNRLPYEFLATSPQMVRRIHSSSGTKGNPTIIFYSDNDLLIWHEHLSRVFMMADLVPGDIFQTIVGFGLFSGGLGFQMAAEQYGLSVIPIGMGNTEKQVKFLIDYKVNCFITISSYLPILANYLKAHDINPRSKMKLKSILIGAEPFNLKIREDLRDFFGVPILSVYGMSEMEGPGVASECMFGDGMHIFTDSYYPEIIDPITLKPLDEGEEGELVLTTLSRECMPLIRFRTGDITKLYRDSCKCNSKYGWKMDYVRSRIDDMFIVKGVNIYPCQLQELLLCYNEIEPFFQIIIDKDDIVTLLITMKNSTNTKKDKCELKIIRDIKTWFNISVKINWVSLDYFTSNTGKAQLVIDKRIF